MLYIITTEKYIYPILIVIVLFKYLLRREKNTMEKSKKANGMLKYRLCQALNSTKQMSESGRGKIFSTIFRTSI
jgi:hypothetical protein